jgi:hypothetical protein
MMAAKASFLAASCTSLTCAEVLHSTDRSARRNSRPVSKRSHEKARKAAELTCRGIRVCTRLYLEVARGILAYDISLWLTIGKTKKLRVRSHGSPASSPANLSFGTRPQQERRTQPSTIAPAITSGASIVMASCCW